MLSSGWTMSCSSSPAIRADTCTRNTSTVNAAVCGQAPPTVSSRQNRVDHPVGPCTLHTRSGHTAGIGGAVVVVHVWRVEGRVRREPSKALDRSLGLW